MGNADLPRASASVAGLRSAALRSATAIANLALREFGDVDFDRVAEDRLIELQLQLITQIRATKHLRAASAASAARGAKDVAEHVAEDVAECIAGRTAASAAARRGLDAGMTVLVIDGALLRIGEDFAGLLGLFEQLLRILVVRIAVRMVLHGEAAIRLLDLRLGCRSGYV